MRNKPYRGRIEGIQNESDPLRFGHDGASYLRGEEYAKAFANPKHVRFHPYTGEIQAA